jgi:hypothetical protein
VHHLAGGKVQYDIILYFRPKAAWLKVRKNFFSSRVTENKNTIPSHVKNVKTASGFKRCYKNHKEQGVAPP